MQSLRDIAKEGAERARACILQAALTRSSSDNGFAVARG
jgi:hypothetical protein